MANNGLHQTGRGGAVASRPVVEARPAGEAECSTGFWDFRRGVSAQAGRTNQWER